MKTYSIIPASITTNIRHGTCTISNGENLELAFDIYKKPDTDLVYKVCACPTECDFPTVNLGTVMTEDCNCSLSAVTNFDTENAVLVIYLKNTKSLEITYEGYCVLNDKAILDIKISENESGMFGVECVFEDENIPPVSNDTNAIENAEKMLDDYRQSHPPSDAELNINKKYFEKILSELEGFKPFLWNENTFKWYKIDSFIVPGNLSSVKYVLFETLSINAFDTYKHYLYGVRDKAEQEKSYYIAIALPSKSDPIGHLNDYSKKLPYNEIHDYYVAYIELAPDGQYFLEFDNEN